VVTVLDGLPKRFEERLNTQRIYMMTNNFYVANNFYVGDKVRTLAGDRLGDTNYQIRVVETGRMWRHYPAILGMKYVYSEALGRIVPTGKKHIYLCKNLTRV
jgi:hypothetical protein